MLSFIVGYRHCFEEACLLKLGDCGEVQLEGPERCAVGMAFGEGATAKVVVVGWAE